MPFPPNWDALALSDLLATVAEANPLEAPGLLEELRQRYRGLRAPLVFAAAPPPLSDYSRLLRNNNCFMGFADVPAVPAQFGFAQLFLPATVAPAPPRAMLIAALGGASAAAGNFVINADNALAGGAVAATLAGAMTGGPNFPNLTTVKVSSLGAIPSGGGTSLRKKRAAANIDITLTDQPADAFFNEIRPGLGIDIFFDVVNTAFTVWFAFAEVLTKGGFGG